jgi:DNA mismatch repair protein MutL
VTDIHALDRDTVQQIAAGEVVERPASVVKELVENSLDADASRVSVAVHAGGTEGVRVRDDGVGMTRDELELAVEEHTTSKIRDVEDLERGVATLGFRGEALSTIGAVSRMTVRSKPRGGEGSGAELRLEGGEVTHVGPAGCPEGTTVEVEDLFYNTPARRKFLKADATEFDHVNTVVTQYALANPDVAVSLDHDDREVFATEGRGDLQSAVLSVYGREVAEAMHRVEYDADGEAVASVSGLVSHPETTRASRDYCSTFVNGRYVRASVLRDAILDAYGGQLAPDRYPFAVLFVDVPPASVDVNVHPRKTEVRFDDDPAVKRAVETAVEETLLSEGLVRAGAPRGRSRPDETTIAPERPADALDEREAADAARAAEASADHDPDAEGDPDPDPALAAGDDSATDPAPVRETTSAGADPGDADRPSGSDDRPAGPDRPAAATGWGASAGGETDPGHADAGDLGASERAGDSSTGADDRPTSRRFRGESGQTTLTGEDARPEGTYERLPDLRVLGQYDDTYLVCETDDGLLLVDQHAADERVNYERLQDAVAGDTATQALAEPVELELTAREAELFDGYAEALSRLGFHAARTGERTVAVRTVPTVVGDALDPDLLRDALSAFVGDDVDGTETVDAVADALLADLACYPSITGNTSLHEGSMTGLLAALDDCRNPFACPHGRPTVVRFDEAEIAERFERDYPGHAGRRRD